MHPRRTALPRACRALALLAVLIGATLALLAGTARAGEHPGFLYEIEKDGGRAFLLGSVHLARPDFYPLPDSVEQAFAQCDVLVMEVTQEPEDLAAIQRLIFEKGFYPRDDGLSRHLSARTLAKMRELGLPASQFETMRPWAFATALGMQRLAGLGYDPSLGLEQHFMDRARSRGLPQQGLESVEEQMLALAAMADGIEDELVYASLLELEDVPAMMEAMSAAWKAGDDAAMTEQVFGDLTANPELAPVFERLLTARNRTMAARIPDRMGPGRTPLLLVGTGHLVGPQSVPELLAAAGYTVTRR